MKIKLFSMLLLISCIAAFSLTADSQTRVSTGSIVFAEWVSNGWYHGTVAGPCENGFTVNFDDGDVKCCSLNQIVADVITSKKAVFAGAKVLAQWTNGRYYPGTVASVSGDGYDIQFDDGDKGTVNISQIRLK